MPTSGAVTFFINSSITNKESLSVSCTNRAWVVELHMRKSSKLNNISVFGFHHVWFAKTAAAIDRFV